MRVKRLEIQGFKSFKDKTVVHFDDGVTGIVGPNGCGKSNIVDAFFWVMGEQSYKHMRAGGQLDLIFNGSEKYSPNSMAEVTLILDTGVKKEDLPDVADSRELPAHLRYEEIAVTRRLFRDGSTEFQINGVPCRLRDIQELFMDTGAGPKAYSIVEQGQISRIVASKADDRRVIIEEAAGISKFKARKKESLRKIEATRQNLNRISDIITEIERQLRSLERQAARARKYKEHKDSLKEKEVLLSRKKLNDIGEQLSSAQKRIEEIETTEVENQNLLQTTELRIENLKIQVTEAQRAAEESQEALQQMQQEVSGEDTKVQLKKRQIEELNNTSLTLDEEFEQLKTALVRLSEEKELLEQECQELEETHKNADSVLHAQQEELDQAKAVSTELETKVEAEKRDLMASMNRQTEISNQVHGLEARVDALSIQINGLTGKIATRETECETLTDRLTEVREEFETSSMRAQSARTRTEELKTTVSQLETELTDLRTREAEAREEKAKTESRFKAIQQLVESHEGLQSDVKNILNDEEITGSLKGVFSDLVQANPGYELSLEAVLHDFLGDIFVDQRGDARDLIQKLKDKSLGRATFWPLDLLEQSSNSRGAFNEDARQKVSSLLPDALSLKDVIQTSHEKADALKGLFQRIFVVNSLDQALDAFVECSGLGVSFVTLEGDILDSKGRIVGGSTAALESGILSRKAELQKLSESLESLTLTAGELKVKLDSVEEMLGVRKGELEVSSKELSESDVAAKSAERDLASTQSQLTVAKDEFDRLKAENESLETERKEHWAKLDGIRQELSGMEDSTKEREEAIEAKSQELEEASKKVSELQGKLVQLKVEFASAKEKLSHGRENLVRIDGELSTKRARREEVETLMNRKLDEKDFHTQELQVLEQNHRDLVEKSSNMQASLSLKKDEVERINQDLSASFEKQKTMRGLVDGATKELGEIRVDQEKWRLEHQMLAQTLFEKYGIQEEGYAPQNEEEREVFAALTGEAVKELQEEVDRLHEKIRKLGEVNVMAMEEYDDQKKRHEFLVSQREDLLKSIQDLERAIQRIDKTSIERFKIAFDEVNMRFQRIYPIIFGGGWGKLTMTNPEDLAETGVDIIAEPPGKKVGSIQLMSGGEKALTAVALIFSIFLIKPSPFCVLDEVDAPLDDSNVGKFNTLLKEMALRSQFIIITHNKRTMELNDKLYGVTMEEPGVSKMVSIQLQ